MEKLALSPRNSQCRRRGASERGVILLLACFAMPLMIGMLGLGIDLGVMYSIKAKLQMACDGAAVSALRSLSLGQDAASQATSAKTVAKQWFIANFAGEYMGASGTTQPTVTVTDGASIRTVSVAATTQAPSYFMKYFGRNATPIGAVGAASRRDVAMMLVLDRSGSMNTANNSYNGLLPCDVMKAATKQFVGMFQQGRDRIGLATFAQTVQLASSPTTNFQSVLGYTNSAGAANGAIDNINCGGGTNTSSAIAVSWNELYKLQLPGAFNILVVFTDGTPTAGAFNFSSVRSAASTCVAGANWVANRQANMGTALSLGLNSHYSDITGMVGAIYGDLSSFGGLAYFWSPPNAPPIEGTYTTADAPGCQFAANPTWNAVPDITSVPSQDMWGTATSGYRPVAGGNVPLDAVNIGNAVFNLADNAASFARSAHVYTNGVVMPGTLVNTIGLGGNGGVDFTLLQRMANDPKADSGGAYGAYPGYNPNQPVGTFLYSSDSSQLQKVFVTLASQILRISR